MIQGKRTANWFLSGALLASIGCQKSAPPPASDVAPSASATPATPAAVAPSPPKRHPVAESDVPKSIRDAFAKAYPTATAKSWTQRGDTFMVLGQDGSHWLSVNFAADGSVKETQEQIAAAAAPDPIKTAFQSSPYAKMSFVDGMKKVEAGKDEATGTLYKFVVKDGAKNLVAVYDRNGRMLKEKTMPGDKFEKWHSEHSVTK